MENTITLAPHIQRLNTIDGFIERYFQLLQEYPTCREAYNAVERQYNFVYGQFKYSSYGTFKVILSRWNRHKTINQKSITSNELGCL